MKKNIFGFLTLLFLVLLVYAFIQGNNPNVGLGAIAYVPITLILFLLFGTCLVIWLNILMSKGIEPGKTVANKGVVVSIFVLILLGAVWILWTIIGVQLGR